MHAVNVNLQATQALRAEATDIGFVCSALLYTLPGSLCWGRGSTQCSCHLKALVPLHLQSLSTAGAEVCPDVCPVLLVPLPHRRPSHPLVARPPEQ